MNGRAHSLDALRGLLALGVAVYHVTSWTRTFGYDTHASSAMTLVGVGAVQAFFVLSGFSFYYAYPDESFEDGPTIARFYLRRIARIAPLYYAAMLANAFLQTGYGAPDSWVNLAENLTLLFGFSHPNHSYLMGGWSIGIEMVFYLAFPFFAAHTRSWKRILAVTCALVLLAAPWTFVWVPEETGYERFHAYVAVPNHFFAFFLGAGIALSRRALGYRLPTPLYLAFITAVLVVWLVSTDVFVDHSEATFGVRRVESIVALTLVVAATAQYDVGSKVGRWLAERLGEISYGLYLIHPLVWFSLGKPMNEREVDPLVTVGTTLLVTTVLAVLSYRLLERPVLHAVRRRLDEPRDRRQEGLLVEPRVEAPKAPKDPTSIDPMKVPRERTKAPSTEPSRGDRKQSSAR